MDGLELLVVRSAAHAEWAAVEANAAIVCKALNVNAKAGGSVQLAGALSN